MLLAFSDSQKSTFDRWAEDNTKRVMNAVRQIDGFKVKMEMVDSKLLDFQLRLEPYPQIHS